MMVLMVGSNRRGFLEERCTTGGAPGQSHEEDDSRPIHFSFSGHCALMLG